MYTLKEHRQIKNDRYLAVLHKEAKRLEKISKKPMDWQDYSKLAYDMTQIRCEIRAHLNAKGGVTHA